MRPNQEPVVPFKVYIVTQKRKVNLPPLCQSGDRSNKRRNRADPWEALRQSLLARALQSPSSVDILVSRRCLDRSVARLSEKSENRESVAFHKWGHCVPQVTHLVGHRPRAPQRKHRSDSQRDGSTHHYEKEGSFSLSSQPDNRQPNREPTA
ncbi:hypothetical protein VTK73DRAFT_7056 [Phialemonium thermophilum]|uniref:Uncharacterized protein n=1 Tax=Phialemonium thermophilum TaxID=223376 RepID=A0ABR3WGM1_9PEZI